MKEKSLLIRVVKAPDIFDENEALIQKGSVSLDKSGKKPGRGAYICQNEKCLNAARKARRFEKAFSCKIPDEVYDELEKQLKECAQ